MAASPRTLTKSRFLLALECPTKLFYTSKAEYVNNLVEDSFLQALAEGGYQVGALACLMHPDGVAVDESSNAEKIQRTRELLEREQVTIYEAAFEIEGLFVRVDILRKDGRTVELIEVKAKSYNPADDGDFRGARAGSSLRARELFSFADGFDAERRPRDANRRTDSVRREFRFFG